MEITEIRFKLIHGKNEKLRAFCSITIDNDFVIRDLKVIDGAKGPFVAMPSRKLMARCPECSGKNHFRANFCNDCGRDLGGDKLYMDAEETPNAGSAADGYPGAGTDDPGRRGPLHGGGAPEGQETGRAAGGGAGGGRGAEEEGSEEGEGSSRSKFHTEIAHPINSRCREMIQRTILERYREELQKSLGGAGRSASANPDGAGMEDYFSEDSPDIREVDARDGERGPLDAVGRTGRSLDGAPEAWGAAPGELAADASAGTGQPGNYRRRDERGSRPPQGRAHGGHRGPSGANRGPAFDDHRSRGHQRTDSGWKGQAPAGRRGEADPGRGGRSGREDDRRQDSRSQDSRSQDARGAGDRRGGDAGFRGGNRAEGRREPARLAGGGPAGRGGDTLEGPGETGRHGDAVRQGPVGRDASPGPELPDGGAARVWDGGGKPIEARQHHEGGGPASHPKKPESPISGPPESEPEDNFGAGIF